LLEDIAILTVQPVTSKRQTEGSGIACHHPAMRPVTSNEVAHYVILGFGDFGQTLAHHLAEFSQFENGKRLRLTIADQHIKRKSQPFLARHPSFSQPFGTITNWEFDEDADKWAGTFASTTDDAAGPVLVSKGISHVCNAQYIEYVEATDGKFLEGLNKSFSKEGVKPAILVCFEEDRKNFALGERLRAKLKTLGKNWPIFVWIPRQRELSQLLSEQRGSVQVSNDLRTRNTSSSLPNCDLIPFGQCYGSVSYREVTAGWIDWLARLTHLVWLPKEDPCWTPEIGNFQAALQSADAPKVVQNLAWEQLDKDGTAAWETSEEWSKASNRSAAIHSVVKAAALGLRITGMDHPSRRTNLQQTERELQAVQHLLDEKLASLEEKLLSMEHYRWVSERLINGWRYDNQKPDNTAKTRWQITPWDDLDPTLHGVITKDGKPRNEKLKDKAIVDLLMVLLRSGKLRAECVS
jgi:hypothetical protein